MADKFWQQSSFKDFVSSIKSGKSSDGDDNPSTTPSPFKATAAGRIGTKTGTSPKSIVSTAMVGNQSIISQIIQQQQRVNALLAKYPRNESGQIPLLDPGIGIGDRLYLDPDKQIFTNQHTSIPLYLTGDNVLTPDATDKPAVFLSPLADTMLNDYKMFADSFSTVISNTTKGEKVFEDMTMDSFKTDRSVWSFEMPEGQPFYVSVDGSRNPTVISFKKTGWFGNTIGETGDQTRDFMLKTWNLRKEGNEEMPTIGINLVDDPTAHVFIGLISGVFNFIAKGFRSFATKIPYTSADWVKGSYNQDITGLISEAARRAVAEAGDDTELASNIKDVTDAAKEQLLSTQYQDEFAFKSWDDVADFTLNLVSQAANVAVYSPSDIDLKSQYELKEMVIQGHNDAHTNYDLLDPVGRQQAEDVLVNTYKIERRIGLRDIFASWSAATDPEIENKIFRAVAQLELQKGKELTIDEIDQVKYYFADPSVEFAGQVVFDWNNLLNIPAAAVLPDSTLKWFNKSLGVRNPFDQQLDGLLISSVVRGIGKVVGGAGDLARKLPFVEDAVQALFKRNLYNETLNIPFFSKLSDRALVKRIYQNTSDVFNGLFGTSTARVLRVPKAQFDEINKLGMEIAEIRKQFDIARPEDIVTIIQAEKKFSPVLSTKEAIYSVMAMVDIIDPSKIKGGKGWADMFAAAYGKSKKIRQHAIIGDLARKIGNKLEDVDFDLSDPDLVKIYNDYLQQPADQQTKFLGNAILELSKTRADKMITTDDVSSAVASIFSSAYEEAHTTYDATLKLTIWNRSFSGFVDDLLTKGIKNAGKGASTFLGLVRDATRFIQRAQQALMEGFIRNILTRSPKYTMVQQPIEQYLSFLLSGSEGILSRHHTYSQVTPELLEFIGEMPAATHTGFVSILDTDANALKFTQGLIDFYKENPKAWLPFSGAYRMYFNDSVRKSYSEYLEKLFTRKGLNTLEEQVDFLQKAAQNKKLIGFVDTPKGRVMTINGMPMNPVKQLQFWWNATADAGADLASASEMMTKMKIAQDNFFKTKAFVNDLYFKELADAARVQMLADGNTEEEIGIFIENMKRAWDTSNGNATTFINHMNTTVTGKTPATFAIIPDEVKTMALGMSDQEREVFLIQTRRSLNEYLTMLNTTGEPITQKSIHKFFKDTLDALKQETEEAINPAGLNAFGTMGEQATKIPVSADTQKLLDDIDANGIENSKFVKKATVTSEDIGDKAFGDRNWEGIIPSGKQADSASVRVKELDDNISSLTKELRDEHNSLTQKILSNTATDQDRRTIAALEREMERIENTEVGNLTDQELFQGLNITNKNSASSGFGIIPDSPYSRELIRRHPDLSHTEARAMEQATVTSEIEYTNTLKTILAENGIEIEGKTVQQAIDELNDKVRPIGWSAPGIKEDESLHAINESIPNLSVKGTPDEVRYKGNALNDLFKERPDVSLSDKSEYPEVFKLEENRVRQISRDEFMEYLEEDYLNTIDELEGVDSVTKQQMKYEMANAVFIYRKSQGRMRGIQKNLKSMVVGENLGDEVIAKAYDDIDNAFERVGELTSRLYGKDGMFSLIFPGKSLANPLIDDAHELFMMEHYQVVAYYTQVAGVIEQVADGLEAKTLDLAFPTELQLLEAAGWRAIPKEDGFGIAAWEYIDPITGIERGTFYEGTNVYRAMSSADFFNAKNTAVLNLPLTASEDEVMQAALLSQPGTPLVAISPEYHLVARDEFMRAYISKPYFGDKSLWFYIEPFMDGKSLDVVGTESIVSALRKAAGANEGYVAQSLNEFADHLEHVDNYFNHNYLLGDKHYDIPFDSRMMPDDVRATAHNKIVNAAQLQGIRKAFKVWENAIVQQAEGGLLVLRPLAGKVSDQAARIFADGAAEFQSTLWKGGKLAGLEVEGAVNYANQRMRVGTETVIDQFAKGVIPFWNFSTRGSATWARFIGEHPQIARVYQKYLKFSRGQALTKGLTNRLGQPLPSSYSRIQLMKIGGQDIWFNPQSVMSPFLAYWFPNDAVDKYEDEDPNYSDFQLAMRNSVAFLRSMGARISPLADIALQGFGVDDPYTTQDWKEKMGMFGVGAVLPADLIPPVIWDAVDAATRKAEYPNQRDTWRPEVEWFDYVVEMKILEDYLAKIRTASTEDERLQLALEAKLIIDKREQNPDYQKYVDSARNENWYKQVAGYVTGIYPQMYSAGEFELFAVRDQINLLRTAINDAVVRTLFFPYTTEEAVYNAFEDLRWNTGAGELWNTRSNVSWVTDDRGAPLKGTARRDMITKKNNISALRTEMFAEVKLINDEYEDTIRKLPIGRDYKDPTYKAAREQRNAALLNIYTSSKYAGLDTPWNAGLKPDSVIEDQLSSMFYYMLMDTKPLYQSGMDKWEDHTKRVADWERNLPTLANDLSQTFMSHLVQLSKQDVNHSTGLFGYAEQDVVGIFNKIVQNVTPEFMAEYEKRNDTPIDAVVSGWFALYAQPYMDVVWKEEGARRKQAERAFYDTVQKPTPAMITAWIKDTYGEDRFTDEEIQRAMMTPEEKQRQILNIEEGLEVGDNEDEIARSEIYDLYGRIPKSKKSEFYREINLLGLSSDFETFMNTGVANPFKVGEKDKLQALLEGVRSVVMKMNITEPTNSELAIQVKAQGLNDQLNQMLTAQLGAGWEAVIQEWGQLESKNRRVWAQENPQKAQIKDLYYAIRDAFAKDNPLWAEYYTSSGGGAKYYGYSGRSSRRSGGKSVARSGNQFVPVGMRSTQDANTLLAPENLGKGGVAGMPKLPTQFWEKTTIDLRSEIYRFVNGDAQLSKAAVGFLTRQADRYPEYKPEIDKLLAEEEVTVT